MDSAISIVSSSFVRALIQSIAPEFSVAQSGTTLATGPIRTTSAKILGGIFASSGSTTDVFLGDADGIKIYVANMALNNKNILCCPDGVLFNGEVNILIDSGAGLQVDYTILYRDV